MSSIGAPQNTQVICAEVKNFTALVCVLNFRRKLKSTRENFEVNAVYKTKKIKNGKDVVPPLLVYCSPIYQNRARYILILLWIIKYFYCFTDITIVFLRTIFGWKLFKDYNEHISQLRMLYSESFHQRVYSNSALVDCLRKSCAFIDFCAAVLFQDYFMSPQALTI